MLVMGESTRQVAGQASMAHRYYISALPGTTDDDAKRLHGVMRWPWDSRQEWFWLSCLQNDNGYPEGWPEIMCTG